MRDSLIKLMPWMGGKGQLMWAIQMLLPIHYKTLVDVFGGSGIITLNTAVPKGCLQIYNDLNHDLYNLLFCVKHRPMALTKELSFLPINARDEFDVLRRQLQGEDFTFGGYHGNYGCWWVHINITRKQYAYGMPGVSLALPIGNHAITIDEFKTIYAIFKKYEGKELFTFSNERFDYDA